MKTYVSAILAIILISVAVMTAGCVRDPGKVTDGNQTPGEMKPEANEDIQISTNDNLTTEQTASETVQTDKSEEEVVVSGGTDEKTGTSDEPQPVPNAIFQVSALGDGKYLLEQTGGDNMDLSRVKLIISSHGHTDVYSPLTENSEIMNTGDQMIINIYSGVFTINDKQITVTNPETADSSVVDTSIMLFDINSDKMIAYMTVSG